jgi:asparagine synthetase B (glutamine-hydrolysing)
MCGILTTNKEVPEDFEGGSRLRNRGPDEIKKTSVTYGAAKNLTFIHSLLSMTGEYTPQPYIVDDIICLFNGEIYNYLEKGGYDCEAQMVVDCYKEHGESFVRHLDGEFALVIVDLSKNTVYYTTDVFGIKPLYCVFDGDTFGLCSNKEALIHLGFSRPQKCDPNTLVRINLETMEATRVSDVYTFDLNQHKTTFDDWSEAFLTSISKRFTNIKWDIILGLSSGHDSGAIACACGALGIDFTSYSFVGDEDFQILQSRIQLKDKAQGAFPSILRKNLDPGERGDIRSYISHTCAHFSYGSDLNEATHAHQGIDDPGAHGLMSILRHVKQLNPKIRILASGQGGDEVQTTIQSYAFGHPNPAVFPEDLSAVFPWENFFYGANSSYISKEESISGGVGVEGRYPLLDKRVVQEFLWLLPGLKNKYFKSPITNFLMEHNYPHSKGNPLHFKRGFNV